MQSSENDKAKAHFHNKAYTSENDKAKAHFHNKAYN